MAAPQPFGRRPSGAFQSDYPVGADPRMSAAHAYAPHQGNIFPPHPSDLAHNYQFASGRAPFDQQLPFDGAAGSNVPAWLYDGSHASASQNITGNGLAYHIDTYGSHTSAAASGSIAAASGASLNADTQHHASGTGPPTARFASKSATPADVAPFAVGISDSAAPHSLPGSLHSLVSAVPHTMADRRASDESAHAVGAGPSISDTGSSAAALPPRGTTKSTSESAAFSGSISPTSSARMSGSPEVIGVAQSFPSYTPATVPPMGGMVMGAPVTASMMESIDSWLAPASSASLSATAGLDTLATAMGPAKAVMAPANKAPATEPIAPGDVPSSSRLPGGPAFHPGPSTNSSASMIDGVPFKTSIERRERNKASQRESRKRKQDRLETLEGENAALRKALADMKKFSHALSNGAGIRSEDGTEVAPAQLAKFTGAFHLDLIESHLDDESQEAEWKGMIGRRFPTKSTQVDDTDGDAGVPALSTSDSDEDSNREEPHEPADNAQGSSALKKEREGVPSSASQQVKKAMWEISLNQKRQKAAQSFPSMVAVPELVLYKVCRLYFSTLLPFTTKLKSGIVNLRAAREAPGFIGGLEDLPRFPGDPSFGSSDLYLPKNLMPTEMQMRLGFHPIEIAVMPYPLMRDRMLTVLSAFQAIEELQQEEEDEAAGRISEDSSIRGPAADKASSRQQMAHSDELEAEVVDGDIRQRTALVADMSAWKPKDFSGAVVMPDKGRVYAYGFLEKPRGSHRLRKPAQRWLDQFFYEVVQTLRVWSPAGDVFDGECFEFKESFFRKYPYMVDGEILKATNRWRRARGEDPIRL